MCSTTFNPNNFKNLCARFPCYQEMSDGNTEVRYLNPTYERTIFFTVCLAQRILTKINYILSQKTIAKGKDRNQLHKLFFSKREAKTFTQWKYSIIYFLRMPKILTMAIKKTLCGL